MTDVLTDLESIDHLSVAMSDVMSPFEAFRPPKRMTVAEGAAANLILKQTGGPATPWSPEDTPYMVEPMNMLASRRHEAVCFVGPARTGKCLDINTPIPTPHGWTLMGDLQPGDRVIGDDGHPTNVLAVSEIKHGRPCYRLTFVDGTSVVADDEHLWQVERFYWKAPNWRTEVRTTASMVDDFMYGGNRYRYRVRQQEPLALPDVDLLVDPYVLGVWLGNGSTGDGRIVSALEDASHYECAFEATGVGFSGHADGESCWVSNLDAYEVAKLDAIGVLRSKHIPPAYLRASYGQRLQLLRGLMDTDGFAGGEERSVCEFSTVNESLKDGFVHLARTLGLKPVAALRKTTWTHAGEKRNGTAWRVSFTVANTVVPFSLPRKLRDFRPAEIDLSFRQITNIEPVASVPVKCIAVDNESHLFLAGEGLIPTHNTGGLVLGFLAHAVVNDPGDMLVIQMSQEKARDFSKTDVDRAIRNSPHIAALKSHRSSDDNLHDKMFRHGMFLKIAWPTVGNVSGSTYRYAISTDYDRAPDDIDGEGALFPLLLKRTQTFMSRGMAMIESSPGRDVQDPNWRPATPHEAPPTNGILGVYNTSDRRRWYWKCPDCAEWFEAAPGLGLFNLPPDDQLLSLVREANLDELASKYNCIWCPHCGTRIGPKQKSTLNWGGRWLSDGQRLTTNDELIGTPATSTIAGYWMGGVAAAYQNWKSLVMRHLQGLRQYDMTGDEEALKNTANLDQGMPYMSRVLVEARAAARDPSDRADDTLQQFMVPEWARFLGATVDVQGGLTTSRFVVQVHAFGPFGERAIIDRYNITESLRDSFGGGKAPIDPASFPEDWDVLTERVLRSTYRTSEEGREMRVLMTAVDTGGEKGIGQSSTKGDVADGGVSKNAYAWYRRLRKERMHGKVMLIKGSSTAIAGSPIKETWVGQRSTREKPDVPLYLLDTNRLKDIVDRGLKRETRGPGYIHLPGWMSRAALDELKAEVREKDGKWKQIRKRNETLDLLVYAEAMYLRLGADKITNWDSAPPWARPLEENDQMVTREERRKEHESERLAPERDPAPVVRQRRVVRSSYLR